MVGAALIGETSFGSHYSGKRVLVTGDTGFKGAWLSAWLHQLGAKVFGVGLDPEGDHPIFDAIGVGSFVDHVNLDVREADAVERLIVSAQPNVIFHLAAQSLVRRSYEWPVLTVATNVLGTANVLAAALSLTRSRAEPCAVVVVTSDKSYLNLERDKAYGEADPLGGRDLYSASKAAADIVAAAWQASFGVRLDAGDRIGMVVATCRAGNVIGGGDWAEDRIVPDCIRALMAGASVAVRHPDAVRPWQHVLEPLSGYLLIGSLLTGSPAAAGPWNFGPGPAGERTVAELCDRVIESWGGGEWSAVEGVGPYESRTLRLSIEKVQRELGWRPTWSFETAVAKTVDWYKAAATRDRKALTELTLGQIHDYAEDARRSRNRWAA